ncbi:MAG: ribonuclease HII [Lachnospiraceae bacterium]|nr:ribonuclease HII [Lachnospiraceae bacterium]
MSIGDIKNELKNILQEDMDGLTAFVKKYENDERTGVIATVEQAKKKIRHIEDEILRSKKMLEFEHKYIDMGYEYICGIDEVGRGPLAGPVVSCAVILPKNELILYLNDSKQLSKKKREELYDIILEKAVAYGIGIVSERRIDEINILQATYEAMRMAIHNLKVKPDILLNDAVKIPEVDIKQVPIIKGDTLSATIAAASIVAKVTRDRMMEEYDKIYPGYDFASNKGYGSAKHYEGLDANGPCDIHRRTFIKEYV